MGPCRLNAQPAITAVSGRPVAYRDVDQKSWINQAIASVVPSNPEGCWDWWGYDGPDFAIKSAPQMTTIMNMVHALGG